MSKFITEVLKEVNDDVSLLQTKYKGSGALTYLFRHAFDPEQKFILPEGNPPFKEDSAPLGMTPATFAQELKRLYVFCREDLKPARRELLFIQLIEAIHPSEAKVLLAVKDQNLTELYPNITHKVVADAGFAPPPTTKKEKSEVKNESSPPPKRGRGAKKEQETA